jgi:hypothetical protein
MPDSEHVLERYRPQADELLAVAAKTPLPTIHITLFGEVAVAHGLRATARRNAWTSPRKRVPDR